ncbi:MAG: penicillin-binding protein activator, partial [Lysobacterales bacterium]
MRKQVITLLLILAASVLLSACSTTGERPGDRERAGRGGPAGAGAEGTAATEQERALLQHLPSAQTLAEVERLTSHLTEYRPDVVLVILRKLQPISSLQLKSAIGSGRYSPALNEWLDLALRVRTSLFDGKSIKAAAQRWAENHPGHIINETDFADITTIYSSLFKAPAQVAVLLPSAGGLAAAAKAIRDGILNAYFENPGQSKLRFYDSGGSTAAAITAYQQARAEGATQAIGPLRLESTLALGSRPVAGLPLLLLNDFSTAESGGAALPGINSLTLSQNEEAKAVSKRALGQAQRRAIILVPDNAWGLRIQTAFAETFTAGDGRIIDTARFDSSSTDQDAMLTHLLGIDASIARKRALQAQLGVSLGFEPYRRHDFDFIFLAASPQNGRQIKPLLRYYDAGDVPVYA